MHPTDGALLAMLDEWVDPLLEHVDGCEHCRLRMTALGGQRLVVGALLEELDAPVPARLVEPIIRRAKRRRSRRRELVAAAAGLFVVSVAGATIRTEALRDAARWFVPPPLPIEMPDRQAAPPDGDAPTAITLDPRNDVQIEFAASQFEGELWIVLGADQRVTVTVSEPVPFALRSGKVAIANEGARASYRVVLPKNLERAAIRVAGRVIFAKRQSAIVTEASRQGADSFRVTFADRRDAP